MNVRRHRLPYELRYQEIRLPDTRSQYQYILQSQGQQRCRFGIMLLNPYVLVHGEAVVLYRRYAVCQGRGRLQAWPLYLIAVGLGLHVQSKELRYAAMSERHLKKWKVDSRAE